MIITQNLRCVSLYTDDYAIFTYFHALILKHFQDVLGKKNKILSFYEEDKIPQRKYFLKLLEKKYEKHTTKNIKIAQAYQKTFKLYLKQENTLRVFINIKVEFIQGAIVLLLDVDNKLFISYLKHYFKNHDLQYDKNNKLLSIACKGEETFVLFKRFASVDKHLNFCVNFDIKEDEYEEFKTKNAKTNTQKWKFDALARLFSSYFKTLECSPENNLRQIRQKYLMFAKLHHPDFHQDKNISQLQEHRLEFEKIQIAYTNLKALYSHHTL